jgi:adenine-specific DNA glycosylase
MWQFLTVDPKTAKGPPVPIRCSKRLGSVSHALTHRRYEFAVFTADAAGVDPAESNVNRIWASFADLDRYPLPRPHLMILEMLKSCGRH